MEANITLNGVNYKIDFNTFYDLSITLGNPEKEVTAWYCDKTKIEAVKTEQFTGAVRLGGSVNFNNIFFNPHGNGTHTENVGHITPDFYSVNNSFKSFFIPVFLLTVEPIEVEASPEPWCKTGDFMVQLSQIKEALPFDFFADALIIRTLPNGSTHKLNKNYSNTNPTYLHPDCGEFLREIGVKHLLIDLPSVDREEDNGLLLCHKAFWDYPKQLDLERTITELIYAPDTIKDGLYMLNLQVAPFFNDASPSRPIIYPLNLVES
jgi:arylformamidase